MEKDFLKKYKSVLKFVNSKQSNNRSSYKVDLIHGQIARDIQKELGNNFQIITKETTGKEEKIKGIYMEKRVDIVVKQNEKIIAGIGIKNPLNSFFKNKNNYFENMLGETANIKSNNILYFQIMILPHKIPDWKKENGKGIFKKMDIIDRNKLMSYIKMSHLDTQNVLHLPEKMLILIIEDNINNSFEKIGGTKKEYRELFINKIDKIELGFKKIYINDIGKALIINEYTKYIEKICNIIKKQPKFTK